MGITMFWLSIDQDPPANCKPEVPVKKSKDPGVQVIYQLCDKLLFTIRFV